MEKITVKQAAEKWGVSVRWVQELCHRGEIQGAERCGRIWMIPAEVKYPMKDDSEPKEDMLIDLPKKSPFLDMTNLYHTPGTAESCIKSFPDKSEAAILLGAEFAYSRGEIDKVYESARYLLKEHSGFYQVVSAGLLLSLCAIYRGDVGLWMEAKRHIYEAPCKDDADREILYVWLAAADVSIYNTSGFPEWFMRGDFSKLPVDSHPAARCFYVKTLYIEAHDLATGKTQEERIQGFALMKTLPYVIEPLISQTIVEKMVLPEIYLRLICAIAYHNTDNDELAIVHIDKAIQLALPDRLYGPLVEYRRPLDTLLDDRLMLVDIEAAKKVRKLHKELFQGWVKLHNILLDKKISSSLSTRERQIAKYAAFGFSNAEIAKRLNISQGSVKSTIFMAMNKTGAKKRSDLGAYV